MLDDKNTLTNVAEIAKWLDDMQITDYIIQDDLTVNVENSVTLNQTLISAIPIQFGIVSGNFDVSQNQLTSLKGSPHTVGGSFYCTGNFLTSLKYAPKKVEFEFVCEGAITIEDLEEIEIGGAFLHKTYKPEQMIEQLINEYHSVTISAYNAFVAEISGANFSELIKCLYEKKYLSNELKQPITHKSVKL